MRYIIVFLFLLSSFHSIGQTYQLPDGEYMDTTANTDTACREYNVYYYQIGGKYPESSITLLKEVQTYMQQKHSIWQGSGYITFRFRVDCQGHKMKRTQVLQTDEHYKSCHFDKGLVNKLYLFLATLDKWKVATGSKGIPFSYNTIISFKMKYGKVVAVIP